MARLEWDSIGNRYFRAGLDRGVLYPKNERGVPWNGLISVDESPSGGAPTPLYMDGVKYFNEADLEEFYASISAYTYPEEFENLDGSGGSDSGLSYGQQPRRPFDLTYRTLVGNDTDNVDYGYKIHLIFNALASPTSISNQSLSGDTDAVAFSWDITTTPVAVSGKLPTAHLTIDSRKSDLETLQTLEDILYGSSETAPRFPSMSEVIDLFDDWPYLQVNLNYATGLYRLTFGGAKDLKGNTSKGIYTIPNMSRLEERDVAGIYRMG